jgi:hypothetical protein
MSSCTSGWTRVDNSMPAAWQTNSQARYAATTTKAKAGSTSAIISPEASCSTIAANAQSGGRLEEDLNRPHEAPLRLRHLSARFFTHSSRMFESVGRQSTGLYAGVNLEHPSVARRVFADGTYQPR